MQQQYKIVLIKMKNKMKKQIYILTAIGGVIFIGWIIYSIITIKELSKII